MNWKKNKKLNFKLYEFQMAWEHNSISFWNVDAYTNWEQGYHLLEKNTEYVDN